jgi:ribonuclease P protein component
LEQKIKYTLGKNERLKSRKTIEQLFKDGKSFNAFPLRIFYLMDFPASIISNNKLQAGFSVSNRNFKKAVDRNRIKRLMREAYRLQKNVLEENVMKSNKNLAVFFIYTDKELPDYKPVFEKVQSGIKRLIKIINEDSIPNT